jgi:peroxiredoxin Q/BCP
MALKVGTQAPDFSLPSTSGKDFKLSEDMAGKPCIIYFYPKDFTPGCTAEACDFRDNIGFFKGFDIDIIGVSRDDIPTHLKFKEEYQLPFELLADISGKISEQYKALIPLLRLNKRITYLLDASHKVAAVYEQMFGAKQHIKAMIEEIKKTQ